MTPDDIDFAGTCAHESAMGFTLLYKCAQLSAIEKDIIVKLAGPIAERQYLSLDFNAEGDWGDDLTKAKALVKIAVTLTFQPDPERPLEEECTELLDRLAFDTERLVNSNWSSIERVALALIEFSDLDPWHVDDLIAGRLP